jgi:integrase
MLKLQKLPQSRSPYYYIRGTIKGQFIFKSTGTADKRQAEEFRRKVEAEVYEFIALGKQRPATFADAVSAYVTSGGDKRFLLRLLEWFKETPVADIRQAQVDACSSELYPNAKASTINRQCISPIITVIKHAVDTEMPGAILRKIRRRREEKPIVTPATDEHIEKLSQHLSPGLRALVTMMTFTGLRTGEALRVREEDLRGGFIYIAKTKNGEARMVPIPEGWEWPPGGWGYSTTQGVGLALRRAHKAAGLPYRDGHELGRHAFAARWLAAGKGMKGLQLAGGWKKFSIPADIYGHLEMTDVHSQMRELSRGREKTGEAPVRHKKTIGQATDVEQKKGRDGVTLRPKSREETPRKGMQDISVSRSRIWQCGMMQSRGPWQNFARPVKFCRTRCLAIYRIRSDTKR